MQPPGAHRGLSVRCLPSPCVLWSAFTRDGAKENAATMWSIHLTRDDESFKELKSTSTTLITGRRMTHAPFILARATALRDRLDHEKNAFKSRECSVAGDIVVSRQIEFAMRNWVLKPCGHTEQNRKHNVSVHDTWVRSVHTKITWNTMLF